MKRVIIGCILSGILLLTGCGNSTPSGKDCMRLQIQTVYMNQQGRVVAVTKSLERGTTLEVDISDAYLDPKVDRLEGSVLYYSDPAKNEYDPARYLQIMEK